jgi:alpha-glucosidase
MDNFKLFTFDPRHFPSNKVKEFINELHSNNQKYVLIVVILNY